MQEAQFDDTKNRTKCNTIRTTDDSIYFETIIAKDVRYEIHEHSKLICNALPNFSKRCR